MLYNIHTMMIKVIILMNINSLPFVNHGLPEGTMMPQIENR